MQVSASWSIVTVTFNSAEKLRQFWTTPIPENVQWIVVDNNSTDDSAAVARELGAAVVIVAERNLGFSAANNAGLKHAVHDYVAFVNPDVSVKFEDLPELAERIKRRGGLVSPQLLNNDGSLQPNGRGAPLLFHKILNRITGGKRLADSYLLFADPGHERSVVWLIGAVVAGRAETFAALAGWDERYFLYYEDKDISLRAWRSGYSVVLCGQFQWTHGWARETTKLRFMPWVREIASMTTFYSRYPEFIFGGAESRDPRAVRAAGSLLAID